MTTESFNSAMIPNMKAKACLQPMILNPAVETANHAKYANRDELGINRVLTQRVNEFGTEKNQAGLLFSRISRISRFIPTAVSELMEIMRVVLSTPRRRDAKTQLRGSGVFASLLLCVFALNTFVTSAATNDLSGLLQRGLFEEEANRNLDAASAAYQTLVTQLDKDRHRSRNSS